MIVRSIEVCASRYFSILFFAEELQRPLGVWLDGSSTGLPTRWANFSPFVRELKSLNQS